MVQYKHCCTEGSLGSDSLLWTAHSQLFNVLFTFSLSLIQLSRQITSEAIQEVVYGTYRRAGVESTLRHMFVHPQSGASRWGLRGLFNQIQPSAQVSRTSLLFPFGTSAALGVMRTSTNNHLMNCSVVACVAVVGTCFALRWKQRVSFSFQMEPYSS